MNLKEEWFWFISLNAQEKYYWVRKDPELCWIVKNKDSNIIDPNVVDYCNVIEKFNEL